MKKSQLIPIALLAILSMTSCGEKGTNGDASDEKRIEMYGEDETFYDFSTLVTYETNQAVYVSDHKKMEKEGDYDASSPIVRQFRFIDSKTNYAYVELEFTKGDQKEYSFLLYASDDNGQFDKTKYILSTPTQHPCLNCKMDDLVLVAKEGTDKRNIKGTFTDNETGEKITRYMNLDPATNDIKWGPKFWAK